MIARAKRWLGRFGVLLAVVAVSLAAGFAPGVLRKMDAFRVRHVEVVGTRFTEPYAVVRAAGLDEPASLFDDVDSWRAGVRTLPLVADVAVRRKLPGRVALEVREVTPVALVSGEMLRPVDATGRLLPLDPAGEMLDLPIVVGVTLAGGRVVGPGASAVAVLTALAGDAPELAGRISQVVVSDGAIRLAFRSDAAEAVLPLRPSEVQLAQLRLTFSDLVARGELDRVRAIDVRFRDQVVVSFLGTPLS